MSATSQQPGRPHGNSVIDHALAVLRCFSAEEPLLGVTEIASRVGLHKSSVSRILATLYNSDLVEQDPASRQYRLGMGLITVSGPLLATMDVRRVAYPHMQELTAQTGETTALLLWNGFEAVCVEQLPSPHPIKHTSPLGTRYNTAYSSSVQLFLSGQPEPRIRSLVMSGAIELPVQDESHVANYLEKLAEVRLSGVALNYGKTSVDEVGICAGIRDHRGDLVAGLMIAAPRFRVGEEQARHMCHAVGFAATEISRRMGHTGA